MSKIRKDIIDKILETAKIEEVIQECLGSYSSDNKAGLKKCGVRYEALCPFHTDKSLGSFVVYPKGNCYKCFSCGAKGGVIDFLMEREKLTYPDAIRWLGKKYNIPVDEVPVDWKYVPKPSPRSISRCRRYIRILLKGRTDGIECSNTRQRQSGNVDQDGNQVGCGAAVAH